MGSHISKQKRGGEGKKAGVTMEDFSYCNYFIQSLILLGDHEGFRPPMLG